MGDLLGATFREGRKITLFYWRQKHFMVISGNYLQERPLHIFGRPRKANHHNYICIPYRQNEGNNAQEQNVASWEA